MADYLVTGRKGNGKSLICVSRIREALLQGRPVATNLDLRLEHLLPHGMRKAQVYRLPDQPTRADLDAIGCGNPQTGHLVDESKNGLVVLDELATWLNARTFSDPKRQGVLDWLVHSRKLGWDTYLIAQSPNQIDKQVREALVEYHVICRRMDRIKIMGFGLPRMHVGFVKYGMERDSITSEKWWYRGNDLFRAYDTRQKFSSLYAHGLYSYLPPWHLVGWRAPLPWWRRLFQPKPRPIVKRHPLAELVAQLPPDERIRHWRRLEQAGAFS